MVVFTIPLCPQKSLFWKKSPNLSPGYVLVIHAWARCMWIIGLTGAVGAGKSLVSSYFRSMGIPVHCSDEFVHFLFENDQDVHKQIKRLWPNVIVKGKINRSLLGEHVLFLSDNLRLLENIVYPKLAENQKEFLKKNQKLKKKFVVLDVPLLFEVALDAFCHCIIFVSAMPALRKHRVLRRQGMTSQKFYAIEALQMKERDKKIKANFILYTGRDKGNVLKTLKKIFFLLSQHPIPTWQGKWPKTLKRKNYESKSSLRHRNYRV